MLIVTVNGIERSIEAPCSVSQLVERLDLAGGAYAVEVNRRLVPRRDHLEHRLEHGDVVEVVTLVGGG